MAKVTFELNRDGVRDLLQSPEMEKICSGLATEAASRCGDGYKSDSFQGKNRVNAMVWADTPAAVADNAENNTILKALK